MFTLQLELHILKITRAGGLARYILVQTVTGAKDAALTQQRTLVQIWSGPLLYLPN